MMKMFTQALAAISLILTPLFAEAATLQNVQLDTRAPAIIRALDGVGAVGGQSSSAVTVGTISGSVASFTTYYGSGANLTGIATGAPAYASLTGIPLQVAQVSNSGSISLTNLGISGTLRVNGALITPNPSLTWYGIQNIPAGVQAISATGMVYNIVSGSLFIGSGVEPSATTGTFNTCQGINACYGLTTGVRNTAFGSGALSNIKVAGRHTAVGYSALRDISTTSDLNCTAIGNQASEANVYCRNSNIVGSEAGRFAREVSNSIAFGAFALDANNGVHWNAVSLGYNTLTNLTYGLNVIAIGAQSAASQISATNIILIGANTGTPSNPAYANFLNIGNAIYGDLTGFGTNTVGGSSKIGINQIIPTANLDVSGTIRSTSLTTAGSLATGGLTVTGNSSQTAVSMFTLQVSSSATFIGSISTSLAGATSASLCVLPSGAIYRGTPNC